MHIIINSSLMVPIYEQIMEQIKTQIRDGSLRENDSLPSVRVLSKELKITVTVHGKGTYVAAANPELLLEEQKKEVEADLELAIQKGRRYGLSTEEIRSLFELILED